jgi:hypothetical protein
MDAMARGYSSELSATYLCKTTESDLTFLALSKGDLRKSDMLMQAAVPSSISVSGPCCAEDLPWPRAAKTNRHKRNSRVICIFTLYWLLSKHSPPSELALDKRAEGQGVAQARGLNKAVMPD